MPLNEGWRLAVGEPFSPEVTEWPERFEYRYFQGNHLLQICAANLTACDIERFSSGQVHVGLFLSKNVIFFLFKIAGLYDWSDQAFSLQLIDAVEDRELPPAIPNTHQVLSVVLVEATTGLVKAMRVVTYSKHATAVLHRALQRQLDEPFDKAEHAEIIADVYTRYPESKQLAKAAIFLEKAGSQL
jgi:hypothetical protein